MPATDPSRPGAKTAAPKRARAARPRVPWADVLRGLQLDDVRSEVLGAYRAAGFGPEDWTVKQATRVVLMEALVRAEDRLEAEGSKRGERLAQRVILRDLRRRLELELWP